MKVFKVKLLNKATGKELCGSFSPVPIIRHDNVEDENFIDVDMISEFIYGEFSDLLTSEVTEDPREYEYEEQTEDEYNSCAVEFAGWVEYMYSNQDNLIHNHEEV